MRMLTTRSEELPAGVLNLDPGPTSTRLALESRVAMIEVPGVQNARNLSPEALGIRRFRLVFAGRGASGKPLGGPDDEFVGLSM